MTRRRKIILSLLMVPLLLGEAVAIRAQEQAATGPPKVLRIYREEVKPGRAAAHERTEAAWARAFRAAKYSAHYLALTSLTGPSEAWFIEGHDSLASAEQAEQFIEKNAALRAEVARIAAQDGEYVSGVRSLVAMYRENMSYRATGVNIAQMRYFYVTTFRVRPGHSRDFMEANKLIREAHEKANVPEHWATFEVTMGMPGGTYLTIQPLKSLAEVDAFPQTHGEAFQQALGEEGRKKLAELSAAAVLSSETNILAFSPRMSYVSKETAAADPGFWTPKVKAAAKPAAEAKTQ